MTGGGGVAGGLRSDGGRTGSGRAAEWRRAPAPPAGAPAPAGTPAARMLRKLHQWPRAVTRPVPLRTAATR